jgi:hypothetical protein
VPQSNRCPIRTRHTDKRTATTDQSSGAAVLPRWVEASRLATRDCEMRMAVRRSSETADH